ncbi:hypothetical protein LshimejAT787_1101320 [Lyophyllum shimeji]|uniref:Uncharacterized protein n=1 Tax=Lyophyllum shimeji TaxID=47721 RepID=A0A9P3URD4_LYOSH|nr:hypothetical protein LshimejAT787_1101320 [Lyophyllum shimeji]
MGRWTQFEEDAYRLPEGMKRTAYDADTKMYTFRDRNGTLYRGAPGEDYGTLTPVSDTGGSIRPGAFESDEPRKSLSVNPSDRPSTFQDILPANLITATTSPVDKPLLGSTSPTSSSDRDPRALWKEAVGRSALPKMQGVVHNLRRSVTSTRRKERASGEDEGLLRRSGSSDLQRAPSVATTRTAVSLDIPMSVNHRK